MLSRSRRLRRFLTPLVLIASVGGLLSACGPAAPYAAKVNGDIVKASDIDRQLTAFARDQELVGYVETQFQLSFRGSVDGTFDAVAVARIVGQHVQATMIRQDLARRNIKPSAEEVEQAKETLQQQYTVGSTGASAYDRFPKDLKDVLLQQQADLLAFENNAVPGNLDRAALQIRYDKGKADGSLEKLCVSHILVASAATGGITPEVTQKATALRAEVTGGADFAAVATRASDDKGSAVRGGALDCFTREGITTSLVPDFAKAALALQANEVSSLVQTQFGLHIIKVTSRSTPTFDDVLVQLQTEARQENEAEVNKQFNAVRKAADVKINPRFGRWDTSDPDDPHVEAPIPPTTTLGPDQTPRNAPEPAKSPAPTAP